MRVIFYLKSVKNSVIFVELKLKIKIMLNESSEYKLVILILSAIFITGIVSGWLLHSSEYRINAVTLKYQDSIYAEITQIRTERDGLNKRIDSLTFLFNTGTQKLSNQLTQLKYEKPPQVNYTIVSDSALLKRLLSK